MPEIQTPRLRLRQWQDSDRAAFAALNADENVMEYFESTLSRAQSDAMVQRITGMITEHGYGFFAAERRDSKQLIGFIGISHIAQGLEFAPCVEVGWRLAQQHWGQGFATEGARAALEFGFQQHKLPEVVSFTPVQNSRSEGVMKKLGMRKQASHFIHPALPLQHSLAEHVLYKISHQEWQNQRITPLV